MRYLATLPLLLVLATPANAETRNFSVSGFERIRVEGPYRVEVRTGVAPFARAEGPGGAIADIDLNIESRTLTIKPSASGWGGFSGDGKGQVTIVIGTHELASAALSGPGSLTIDKVKAFDFSLGLGGSGTASIGAIDADRLKLAMAGTGVIKVAGEAKQLDIAIKGQSGVEADALRAKEATIVFAGSGSVAANVSGTATVSGKGSGNVTFSGGPACTIKAEGSGAVTGCR